MKKATKEVLKKVAAISKFAAIKAAGEASIANTYQPKEPACLRKATK